MSTPPLDDLGLLYVALDEDARLTKDIVGRVEFLTTTHALDPHLNDGDTILDVAAGCGIYAFHYAARGNAVWAQDILPGHVAKMRARASREGVPNTDIAQGDACDLSRFADGFSDVVLCMGPLYHVEQRAARQACVRECLRVLKSGGLLAVSYLNAPMSRDEKFAGELGNVRIDTCFFTSTPEDTEDLLRSFDVDIIDHVAADGLSRTLRVSLDAMTNDEFDAWMEDHLRSCRSKAVLEQNWNGFVLCRKE